MKIWNEILLIDKLRKEHKLTAEEYKILLECQDSNCLSCPLCRTETGHCHHPGGCRTGEAY